MPAETFELLPGMPFPPLPLFPNICFSHCPFCLLVGVFSANSRADSPGMPGVAAPSSSSVPRFAKASSAGEGKQDAAASESSSAVESDEEDGEGMDTYVCASSLRAAFTATAVACEVITLCCYRHSFLK